MADLRGRYDSDAKPSSGFEVLPAGVYTVKITGGDWKDTKNKNGRYLQINMEVIDGPHQGALIVDRFNLDNPSQEAVRIANTQFAALRKAVGIPNPKDTADLMGPRFQLVLKCEKRNDEPNKMTNSVQRYIEKGQAATTPRQNDDDAPWSRNAPPASREPEPVGSELPF